MINDLMMHVQKLENIQRNLSGENEELREAADNYFNEPEKLMYYPLTSRNSDYERSSLSFATPNKFRKEFSLHDLKPICEKKDNNDEKIIIPSKQNLRKR